MLKFLDYFFLLLHLAVLFFNLFGWIHPRTRIMHRWCVGITLFCWLVVGLWVGTIGYCPLTDWHWQVKEARGLGLMPDSFIDYLLRGVGPVFPAAAVVAVTGWLWVQDRGVRARH